MNYLLGLPSDVRSFLKDSVEGLPIKAINKNQTNLIQDGDCVIRYGVTKTIKKDIVEINPAGLLRRNKHYEKQAIADAGLPTTLDLSLSERMLVRPLKHSKGKEFYVCDNEKELENAVVTQELGVNWYVQAFIEKKREFRVHIANRLALVVQEKEPTRGTSNPCWNHDAGFYFQPLRWNDIPKGLCPLASKAVDALGLDFGAVDIIEDKDGNFIVLEVNTSPAMGGPYSVERYKLFWNYCLQNNFKLTKPKEIKRYVFRFDQQEQI